MERADLPQLRTMSSSTLMTYLLQSPCYLLGYLAILGFGWSSGRFKDSVWHVVRPLIGVGKLGWDAELT